MTTVYVMLGGPYHALPEDWENSLKDAVWIGVDRGTIRLIKSGIVPNLALGDFDSVNEEEFVQIKNSVDEVVKVQSEKDDTDSELAIVEAFERYNADKVVLFGGTGGRLDHLFSVFLLPVQPRFASYVEKIVIKDNQNTVTYHPPGEHQLEKEADKKYLSFIGVTPVKSLTLKGLKYPLMEQDVSHPTAYVSNEFIGETAQFSFKEGLLAVIQSKD